MSGVYVCCFRECCFCVCKQKTAYEVRISDWSSDVCSSDLLPLRRRRGGGKALAMGLQPARQRDALHQRVGRRQGGGEIGRASCRDRVCQYVALAVVGVALKKKTNLIELHDELLAVHDKNISTNV